MEIIDIYTLSLYPFTPYFNYYFMQTIDNYYQFVLS